MEGWKFLCQNIKLSGTRRHIAVYHLGSIWIQFIFVEIENWNWKYYNEIIFKRVNSVVTPIFNEKITEKCNLWDSWTVHGCIVHREKVKCCDWKKKKKRNIKEQTQTQLSAQFKRALDVHWDLRVTWLISIIDHKFSKEIFTKYNYPLIYIYIFIYIK